MTKHTNIGWLLSAAVMLFLAGVLSLRLAHAQAGWKRVPQGGQTRQPVAAGSGDFQKLVGVWTGLGNIRTRRCGDRAKFRQ
jgi:hypothetical protein